MTAPLPLISSPVPPSAAPNSGRNAITDKNGLSFADVLSRQGATLPDSARSLAASSAATPANPDELAALDDAQNAATLAEAGALAVAAQQIIASTPLAEQALALAAQGAGLPPGSAAGATPADALQAASGQAHAALASVSTGAKLLTAALSSAATGATPAAPAALTADQAAALAADAARQATADTPVLTKAVKPVVADVEGKIELASQQQPALRLTPAIDVPARAQSETSPKPLPAEEGAEVLPSTFASLQAATVPQHAAPLAEQASTVAAMVNAGTQRQALPTDNAAALAQPVTPASLHVATPVGATHWGTELGQQLVAMGTNARNGMHTAELRLDPPDLGPLRVTLNLSDGLASASFVSAHASVRHAIETALPQLQQSLAQAGISLGQTSVGEQSAQQDFGTSQQGNGSQRQGSGGQMANATVDVAPAQTASPRNANALVDTFA